MHFTSGKVVFLEDPDTLSTNSSWQKTRTVLFCEDTHTLVALEQAGEQDWGQQVPAPVTVPCPCTALPTLSHVMEEFWGRTTSASDWHKAKGNRTLLSPHPLGTAKARPPVSLQLPMAVVQAPCSGALKGAWRKTKHHFLERNLVFTENRFNLIKFTP